MVRKRSAHGNGSGSGVREMPFEAQGKRARRTRDGLRPGPDRAQASGEIPDKVPDRAGTGGTGRSRMSLNYQRRWYHSD